MDDLKLAKVSEASYTGVKPLKRLGFNKVIKFRSGRTGTKAYLAINESKHEAVLVFRGTEKEGKDILTDIKFGKKDYKGDKIHRGFLTAYKSVKRHIDREVSLLPESYKIYVTGHSLGGALACLYALYGAVRPFKVVTYGQPRVGDKNLASKLKELPYTRYVHHADIVARVPKLGYHHSTELKYITNLGAVVDNPSWFGMFRDRVFAFFDRLTDHKISHYVKSLL